MLELKKINELTKSQLDEFIQDWGNEKIIPSSLQKYEQGYDKFVSFLNTMEIDPPRLMVPSTMFFLVEDDNIVGTIEIRHFLNDGLLKYGGHIGYGVAPSFRGNGYAQKMFERVKPFLKNLGLEMVLICCNKENKASEKTILNCGGNLENKVDLIQNGKHGTFCRYWVEVK